MKQREVLTITLSWDDQIALTAIAAQNNCYWGDRPSVAQLIRRIARKEIRLMNEINEIFVGDCFVAEITGRTATVIGVFSLSGGDLCQGEQYDFALEEGALIVEAIANENISNNTFCVLFEINNKRFVLSQESFVDVFTLQK